MPTSLLLEEQGLQWDVSASAYTGSFSPPMQCIHLLHCFRPLCSTFSLDVDVQSQRVLCVRTSSQGSPKVYAHNANGSSCNVELMIYQLLVTFVIGRSADDVFNLIEYTPSFAKRLWRAGPEHYEQDHDSTASVAVIEGMQLPTGQYWPLTGHNCCDESFHAAHGNCWLHVPQIQRKTCFPIPNN